MSFKKTILLAALVLFAAGHVAAQDTPQLKWGVRFDTKLDNREFSGFDYPGVIGSKSYFSVRLAPTVGIGWGGKHSLMAGGSFTFDMGAPLDSRPKEPLIYYNYEARLLSLYAGKFERRHLAGAYSRAIYAGSSAFYDNVIDGFAVQLHPSYLNFELVLDWDGAKSANMRESFRVLSALEVNWRQMPFMRWVEAGYSFDMYHLASSAGGGEGVAEHLLLDAWVGAAFEVIAPWFEKLKLRVGAIGSSDNERALDNPWIDSNGVTADFTIQKWKVGIRNRLYAGDALMTMYGTYGSRIYKGDPFYSVSNVYNYTQIYWNPHIGNGVSLMLEVGLHTDGKGMGFQQVGQVGITFDNEFFKKKK